MFINIHTLTAIPPSCLNRDDTGRPKMATVGGAERLRLSSQSLKRALRTSPAFLAEFGPENRASRSRLFAHEIAQGLVSGGVDQAKALLAAEEVLSASTAAAKKPVKKLAKKGPAKAAPAQDPEEVRDTDAEQPEAASGKTGQMLFLSREEVGRARGIARRILAGETVSVRPEDVLQTTTGAVDLAMFGRMLAEQPAFNIDAAVQIAHSISTHRVRVDDDYFTAVDDLQSRIDDAGSGAGHVDEAGFIAGVVYSYACINMPALVRNLGGDVALARRAVETLVRLMPVTLPSGKQNSFAAHVRAAYVGVEIGSRPLSMVGAFYQPVRGGEESDLVGASIEALERHRADIDAAYGPEGEYLAMRIGGNATTLSDLVAWVGRAAEPQRAGTA